MQIIPLVDVVSQTLSVNLGGQACTINLYTKSTGFYCDLYVSDVLIVGGVACRNLSRVVISDYLGFAGELMFQDTQGTDDPSSPGLGTRFLLMYIEATDLTAAGLPA
jgi:hypothetical protein